MEKYTIQVRMDLPDVKRLRRLAKLTSLPLSTWVRTKLTELLAKEIRKPVEEGK